MKGVIGVIKADDITGLRKLGMVERDQPAFIDIGDTIRNVADPIVAIFAETLEIARKALEIIQLTYEELPGVYTIAEANALGTPKVWENRSDNIFYQNRIERGEIDKVIADTDVVVAGEFSTSRIAHGFMEPECGLARPTQDGGIEVFYPTQSVFDDQLQLADLLALPREKVRIIQTPSGGAFGGKEDIIFHDILALAALKFGRPAKISLTRDESVQVSQKKHPMNFTARLAVDRKWSDQRLRCGSYC